MKLFWRRAWLWLRIIGREHWGERRYGPVLAWQTAKILWPKDDDKKWSER